MEVQIPMITNNPPKKVFKVEKNFKLRIYFQGYKQDYIEELNGLLTREEYNEFIKRANKIVKNNIATFLLIYILCVLGYILFAILDPRSFLDHQLLLTILLLVPLLVVCFVSFRFQRNLPIKCKAYKEEMNAKYGHRNLKFSFKRTTSNMVFSIDLKIKYIYPNVAIPAQMVPQLQPQYPFIQHQQQHQHQQVLPYVPDYNIPISTGPMGYTYGAQPMVQQQPSVYPTMMVPVQPMMQPPSAYPMMVQQQPQQQPQQIESPQYIFTNPPEPQYVQPPSSKQYIPLNQNEQ